MRIPERRWKKGKPLGWVQAPIMGFYVNLVPNEDYNYAVIISVLDSTISGSFYKNPLARGVANYFDQVKLGVHIHFGAGLTADVTLRTLPHPPHRQLHLLFHKMESWKKLLPGYTG
jgi:hypothetical protein